MKRIAIARVLAAAGFLLATSAGFAAPQQPDNTRENKKDRAAGAVTADQQKDNTSDRDLSKKIRRAIMDDKSLSTYAHNVKVVSQHGKVTLRGPVHNEQEKAAVAAKAAEIAGADNVVNEITVKGDK